MLRPILRSLGIRPDIDLDLMRQGQSLNDLAARCIAGLGRVYRRMRPDLVLVQGDTTSAFSAALAAFHAGIPVGHVEAGLRTWNLRSPWPEEANRQLIARVASLHFAPTPGNRRNLLREGVPGKAIVVTGNTGLDALRLVANMNRRKVQRFEKTGILSGGKGIVLVTAHRRENLGKGLLEICTALRRLCRLFPDVVFAFPVHRNPRVRVIVDRLLRRTQPANLRITEPLEYRVFVQLLSRALLVLTDSGGLQEEGPSLGKPVLVMRKNTERPEGVRAGSTRIVGIERSEIVRAAVSVLMKHRVVQKGCFRPTRYGDGRAAKRVVTACLRFLCDGLRS